MLRRVSSWNHRPEDRREIPLSVVLNAEGWDIQNERVVLSAVGDTGLVKNLRLLRCTLEQQRLIAVAGQRVRSSCSDSRRVDEQPKTHVCRDVTDVSALPRVVVDRHQRSLRGKVDGRNGVPANRTGKVSGAGSRCRDSLTTTTAASDDNYRGCRHKNRPFLQNWFTSIHTCYYPVT